MHFQRKQLQIIKTTWSNRNLIFYLSYTLLYTTTNYSTNTLNIVSLTNRNPQRTFQITLRRLYIFLQSIQNCYTANYCVLVQIRRPTLEPRHLVSRLYQIFTMKSRIRNYWALLWLQTSILKHTHHLCLNLIKTLLRPITSIHLVNTNNYLLNTQKSK